MDKTSFDQLLHFVAPAMRPDAVIAGGFAVDPLRATDIDVFTLWRPTDYTVTVGHGKPRANGLLGPLERLRTVEEDQDTLVKHLEDIGVDFEVNENEPYGEHRYLVATVHHAYAGKSLQLVATDYETPLALVDSFDLSVHALAKHWSAEHNTMRLTFGTHWTPIGDPIRVLRHTTPDETQKRLVKLQQRYGIPQMRPAAA